MAPTAQAACPAARAAGLKRRARTPSTSGSSPPAICSAAAANGGKERIGCRAVSPVDGSQTCRARLPDRTRADNPTLFRPSPRRLSDRRSPSPGTTRSRSLLSLFQRTWRPRGRPSAASCGAETRFVRRQGVVSVRGRPGTTAALGHAAARSRAGARAQKPRGSASVCSSRSRALKRSGRPGRTTGFAASPTRSA